MKLTDFARLSLQGLEMPIQVDKSTLIGTVVLGEHCNLGCNHCIPVEYAPPMPSYDFVVGKLLSLFDEGVRFLFFCGSETLQWQDGNRDVRDLVCKAKHMGFSIVNVVTKGSIDFNIPGANLVLAILEDTSSAMESETFGNIANSIAFTKGSNVCVYMKMSTASHKAIEEVGKIARENPFVNSLSFHSNAPSNYAEKKVFNHSSKDCSKERLKKIFDKSNSNLSMKNMQSYTGYKK